MKIMKKIKRNLLSIAITLLSLLTVNNQTLANTAPNKIAQGKYILVSFSMPDYALRDYFKQAEEQGFVLVLRGLYGNKQDNKILKTREKLAELKINAQINPNLFAELSISQVPVIVVVDDNSKVKKVSGHIPLTTALEILSKDK